MTDEVKTWKWAQDGSGQWLETVEETLPLEAIPDYLNALEAKVALLAEALADVNEVSGRIRDAGNRVELRARGISAGDYAASELDAWQSRHAEALARIESLTP